MKYLKIVDTEAEYNALLASDELQKPYVVLCRETLDLAYGKQTEPDVIDLQIESVGNGQVVVSGFNINLLDSSYARLYYSSTNNFTGALSITLSKYKYDTFKYNGFIPSNSYVKVIVFKGENQTESDVFEYSFTSSSTPTPTTSAPTTSAPTTSAPTTDAPTTDAPTNTSNGITWNWVGETIEVEHTSGGQDYLILYYSEADMPEYTTLAEYVANGYAPLTEDGIPTSGDEKTGLFVCEKTSDYTDDVFDYTISQIIGLPGHLYIAVKGGTLDGVITGKITIPSNV